MGALYDRLNSVGLQYGPQYRTLVQAWDSSSNAVARLRVRAAYQGTLVQPADVDDALCASSLISLSDGETRLPFAVADAQLEGAQGELWAVRRASLCLPAFAAHF